MIRLTNYGCVRESDKDGSNYKAYRFGKNVEVAYHKAPGTDMVFVCADIHDDRMTKWDDRHKRLRHYIVGHDLGWKYNGIREPEFNIKEFVQKCEKLDEYLSNSDEYLCNEIDKEFDEEMMASQKTLVEEFLWRSTKWGRDLMIKKIKEKDNE